MNIFELLMHSTKLLSRNTVPTKGKKKKKTDFIELKLQEYLFTTSISESFKLVAAALNVLIVKPVKQHNGNRLS